MISTPHRQTAVALIDDAVTAGARRAKACAELEVSDRTLRRWTRDGQLHADQRPLVPRPEPANKLTAAERAAVLEACNSTEFASLPPSQIVPKLADQGRYLASESSFYRILRADGQQHHRGRAKPPVRRKPPTSYQASGPCQVWTWDITWMPGPVAGMFFYLYLIVDIFSRKIVGWEVHERESADLAAVLIRQAVLAEGSVARPLVLHADNGSPLSCMLRMHCRAMHERCHHEGDDGKTGHYRLLQPPARQQRQPVLRGAVPHLQVSPGLAGQRLCHKGRCAGVGEILRQLVQRRTSPQRDPLRHAEHAPRRA